MNFRSGITIAGTALVIASICGCEVTRSDAHEYVHEGVKAMDRQTRAQLASLRRIPILIR